MKLKLIPYETIEKMGNPNVLFLDEPTTGLTHKTVLPCGTW